MTRPRRLAARHPWTALGASLGMWFLAPTGLVATPIGQTSSDDARTLHTFDHRIQPPTASETEHYRDALRMIAVSEATEVGTRERALLRGLSWTVRLLDSDETLRFMSAEALEMLHELTIPAPNSTVARAAQSAIRVTADRMSEDLGRYFQPNDQSRWQFIAIIRLLHAHSVDIEPYRAFYDRYFPGAPSPYSDPFHGITFDDALRSGHYRSLGNYLTYTSFLHYLIGDYPRPGFDLPADRFPALLDQLEGFEYALEPTAGDDYREQNYFVTHLAMMLTDWGGSPAPTSNLIPPLRSYIDDTYHWIREQSGDFVLYAEFVEALRLVGLGDDDRLAQGEAALLAYQKPDGSWGSEEDVTIEENPYSAFHPTWAAMAALRHGR